MSKKIKNQIKRSMPVFMIINLILGTVATGLVFNYDISLVKDNDRWTFDLGSKEVEAQIFDTATTSVTVRNAPPTFDDQAYEFPASTSTSPVNVGGSIAFRATAIDQENNRYYLLVCSLPGAAPGAAGAAPSCNGGGAVQYCVSSDFAASTEASCTYNNVTDPAPSSEYKYWYAYVCDNHGTEASCSDDYSRGDNYPNGDDSSPIHINHKPAFDNVWTSVDYQNPGGTFTVTASTTDTDVVGTPDRIWLYVCSSPDWTVGAGCANTTLCSATSTSPHVSCSFATTTPAKDGAWAYHAYVMDWHDFEADDNPRSSSYHVNNVAPSLSSLSLHSNTDITLNIRYAAEVAATTSGTVTDLNGWSDIERATATIYWSGLGENAYGCAADDDDCYPIIQANCTLGVVTGPSARTITCNTTIAFNAIPTDGSLGNYPYGGTYWIGSIKAFDENLSGVGTSSTAVNVKSSTAIEVAELGIPYGNIRGGQNSGSTNATTTIWNYGNTPLDARLQGTDMFRLLGSDYIEAYQQRFSLTTFTYPGTAIQLASSSAYDLDINAAKPTTAALDVYDPIYWGIAIPGGRLSGIYKGTSTFTALLDNNGW